MTGVGQKVNAPFLFITITFPVAVVPVMLLRMGYLFNSGQIVHYLDALALTLGVANDG